MIKDIKIKFAVNGLLAGLLLLSGAQTFGQQQAADISQVVSAAIDSAGSDPVSIEAAIRTVMNDVGPTAAGMQQIASAAMRKVAGYNERQLTASISRGTINAALGQALNTGVNPLHATALVSELSHYGNGSNRKKRREQCGNSKSSFRINNAKCS